MPAPDQGIASGGLARLPRSSVADDARADDRPVQPGTVDLTGDESDIDIGVTLAVVLQFSYAHDEWHAAGQPRLPHYQVACLASCISCLLLYYTSNWSGTPASKLRRCQVGLHIEN